MPFKSKDQMRKCFAMQSKGQGGNWNCKEWAKETPNIKSLPESVKKAMLKISEPFIKIAKELYPGEYPPKKHIEIQKEQIEAARQERTGGMSMIEHRNKVTDSRTGIVRKNTESMKATSS